MPVVTKRLIVPCKVLGTAVLPAVMLLTGDLLAADKDAPFKAGHADSYPARQTNEKITVAVKAFDTEDLAHSAFGKLNPNQYGVLPVLVVIRNGRDQAVRLEKLRLEYVTEARDRIEPTPAADLPYLSGPDRPRPVYGPVPTGAPRVKRRKSPLSNPVLEVRAFSARMLAPGDEASGFFYFQTAHRKRSQAYVTGLREATSGKEIFYFEVPFE